MLYTWIVAICKQKKIETIQSSVHSRNAAAKAFHRSLGFKVIRTDKGYLDEIYYINPEPPASQ